MHWIFFSVLIKNLIFCNNNNKVSKTNSSNTEQKKLLQTSSALKKNAGVVLFKFYGVGNFFFVCC